jgi:substrate import-associated zinc metallohydrolase lipoprotein
MNKYKTVILTVIFAAAVFIFNSCRTNETIDPDIVIPGLGGDDYGQTDLDVWLKANYLDPYNIRVVYRWDAAMQYASSISYKGVPAKVELVKPMMESLSNLWFEPFLWAAPSGFLQKYTPKTITLLGSPQYNASGTAKVLGESQGATVIFLTEVNAFDPSNAISLKGYLHVIEHEFVHILCQNVVMPSSYKAVTSQFYDASNWGTYDVTDSLTKVYQMGFISAYSMSDPEEDFCEVVSRVLVYGLDNFQAILSYASASTVNPNAAANLQTKLNLAAEYYRNNYGIEFFDKPDGTPGLITLVQRAIADEANKHQ